MVLVEVLQWQCFLRSMGEGDEKMYGVPDVDANDIFKISKNKNLKINAIMYVGVYDICHNKEKLILFFKKKRIFIKSIECEGWMDRLKIKVFSNFLRAKKYEYTPCLYYLDSDILNEFWDKINANN